MRRNDTKKTLVLVALVISVLGLSIGFAAFTQNLKITSNVAVTPDAGNFKISFSKNSSSVENGSISPSSGTGSSATILDTTISGLHANFTTPGQSVDYNFYALNTGDYDAYLTDITYQNVEGTNSFIRCTPGAGTSESLVEATCKNINVEVWYIDMESWYTGGSWAYTVSTKNGITGCKLKKGESYRIVVMMKYSSGYVDGPFEVEFGNIVLTYNTVDIYNQ